MNTSFLEKVVGSELGDWTLSDLGDHSSDQIIEIMDIGSALEPAKISSSEAETDEEAIDIDEYLETGESKSLVLQKKQPLENFQTKKSSLLSTPRRYDLSVTYDNYYRTPRLWFQGYDENGTPLEFNKMLEDISQTHLNKTVTLMKHPHYDITMPSVHPCKHAEVMKKMIELCDKTGNEFGVHIYLVIFMKFLQAAIPTIEYDYTRAFDI